MKKVIVIGFISFIFILGVKVVNAKESTRFFDNEIAYFAGSMTADEVTKNCNSLFGDPTDDGTGSGKNHGSLAYYLQKGLDIIKYIGII